MASNQTGYCDWKLEGGGRDLSREWGAGGVSMFSKMLTELDPKNWDQLFNNITKLIL